MVSHGEGGTGSPPRACANIGAPTLAMILESYLASTLMDCASASWMLAKSLLLYAALLSLRNLVY